MNNKYPLLPHPFPPDTVLRTHPAFYATRQQCTCRLNTWSTITVLLQCFSKVVHLSNSIIHKSCMTANASLVQSGSTLRIRYI